MALFTEEIEVYALLGKLFEDLVADEQAAAELQKGDLTVQYQFRKPESTITVKAKADEEVAVQFGPTTFRPEIVYAMDADVAHKYFLGQLNVTTALAHNEIRASGPIAKILELIPLNMPIAERYKAQLEALGRFDLIEEGAEAVPPAEAPAAEGEAAEAPAAEGEAAEASAAEGEAPEAPAEGESPEAPAAEGDAPAETSDADAESATA